MVMRHITIQKTWIGNQEECVMLKKLKKWIVQIMINNEHKYLGLFNSKKVAGTAYMKA